MPRLGGQMLSNAPGPSVWESMALTLVLSDCTQGASLFGTWFQPVCLARVQPFCPGLGVKPFLWQVSSSGPFPVWWSWDTAVRAFRTGTRSGARERQDLQVRRKGLRSQLLSQLSWFVAFPGWMWQRCYVIDGVWIDPRKTHLWPLTIWNCWEWPQGSSLPMLARRQGSPSWAWPAVRHTGVIQSIPQWNGTPAGNKGFQSFPIFKWNLYGKCQRPSTMPWNWPS